MAAAFHAVWPMTRCVKTIIIAACAAFGLLAAALLIGVVLLVRPVKISGGAMEPRLCEGDLIFIIKAVGEVRREDIVTFYFPRDRSVSYIKRVVALPGETVEVRSGKVLINDQPLDEPYVTSHLNIAIMDMPATLVPKHNYFVMGDNRDNSFDSRYWGTVPRELIYGRLLGRYWAASK